MDKQKPYKSPYLPDRVADGVTIPLPKPDYDFEGALSGFDYADPKVYPSSVDPDLEAGMGASAEGIYDNQYSLGGSILDALLDEQADTLNPSAVLDYDALEQENMRMRMNTRDTAPDYVPPAEWLTPAPPVNGNGNGNGSGSNARVGGCWKI